jgi:hypothetical protein
MSNVNPFAPTAVANPDEYVTTPKLVAPLFNNRINPEFRTVTVPDINGDATPPFNPANVNVPASKNIPPANPLLFTKRNVPNPRFTSDELSSTPPITPPNVNTACGASTFKIV